MPHTPENIWVAASDGNLEAVTTFIERDAISPNAKDENTYTPMHAAASYGGDVNITDEDGDTPLYTVESVPVARWLIDHGADPTHRNSEGLTPADHLSDDFPAVANYLLTLNPNTTAPTAAAAAPAVAPEQEAHFTNAQSEYLTRTLLERAETLRANYAARGEQPDADTMERELVQLVGRTVLEGVTDGAVWAADRTDTNDDDDDGARTRPALNGHRDHDDADAKRRRID
ncbi:ankyrin [Auriculariales sp. MPI-PUGE-AT-0066]|nr:ankyrin [Auriculariales sp. MPI-PUGE-AT-0066]